MSDLSVAGVGALHGPVRHQEGGRPHTPPQSRGTTQTLNFLIRQTVFFFVFSAAPVSGRHSGFRVSNLLSPLRLPPSHPLSSYSTKCPVFLCANKYTRSMRSPIMETQSFHSKIWWFTRKRIISEGKINASHVVSFRSCQSDLKFGGLGHPDRQYFEHRTSI